jgi:hypothetical protein
MSNYATTSEAQAYFDTRLNTDSWDSASPSDKLKALTMSTRAIDLLNYIGEKHLDTQENQFPRGDDVVVPDDVVFATCENALSLLEGVNIEEELNNLRVTSERYASIGVTYDSRLQNENLLAGIASKTAWDFLKPYLRDPRAIALRKI